MEEWVAETIYRYYITGDSNLTELREALGYLEPDGPYYVRSKVNRVAYDLADQPKEEFIDCIIGYFDDLEE